VADPQRTSCLQKIGGFEIAIGDVNGDKPPAGDRLVEDHDLMASHPPSIRERASERLRPGPFQGQQGSFWRGEAARPMLDTAGPEERCPPTLLIKHANRDLLLAGMAGYATSFDRIHSQVLAQRFHDPVGWILEGFALPILFPAVGDCSWDEIRDLLMHKGIARFRRSSSGGVGGSRLGRSGIVGPRDGLRLTRGFRS
jgi:hypothetical protein